MIGFLVATFEAVDFGAVVAVAPLLPVFGFGPADVFDFGALGFVFDALELAFGLTVEAEFAAAFFDVDVLVPVALLVADFFAAIVSHLKKRKREVGLTYTDIAMSS